MTAATSSAQELRDAAQRLRTLAKKATPVERAVLSRYEHGGGRFALFDGDRKLIADFFNEGDREFYPVMHPGVALALADWLDYEACQPEVDHGGYTTGGPVMQAYFLARAINEAAR